MIESQHKPNADEWLAWADVVIERLTECAHVYSQKEAVPAGAFMAEAERQKKTSDTVSLLRRIYILVDQSEMPTASVSATTSNSGPATACRPTASCETAAPVSIPPR